MLITGLPSGVIVNHSALLIVILLAIGIAFYWHRPTIDGLFPCRVYE
jgi:hypothetical protein